MDDDYIATIASKLTFVPYKNSDSIYDDDGPISPGAVLRFADGKIELVGNCNTILGIICDHCSLREKEIAEVAHISELLDLVPSH